MMKRKKTYATITELDDYGTICVWNNDRTIPVKYEYEVNGINYSGYGGIAPLISASLKGGVITELYEGKKMKIEYDVDNPSNSRTLWDKNYRNPISTIIIVGIAILLALWSQMN